jgi:hypothetical protein
VLEKAERVVVRRRDLVLCDVNTKEKGREEKESGRSQVLTASRKEDRRERRRRTMVRGIDELGVGRAVVPRDELKSVRAETYSRERKRLGGREQKVGQWKALAVVAVEVACSGLDGVVSGVYGGER